MMLLRLSGHSGAGKSRLTAALHQAGISCPQAVLYTSRPARKGEGHGRDYYFLSRAAIAALPNKDFLVGPVRNMLQAVDLPQLVIDLASNDLVLIEIFHGLWPNLMKRLGERLGDGLRSASVFMTAVDPDYLRSLPDDNSRSQHIRDEVERILTRRKKDEPGDIKKRSGSAIKEILEAIGPDGQKQYSKVFYSAPEGPDKEDDWTREDQPVGQAKAVLDEFIDFFKAVNR